MNTLPDNRLVELARAGDTAAFEALVRRHGHAAAAMINRLITDRHQAEDIFQDTLLQAWRKIAQLRDADRFLAWFVQVARNRCRMHLRRAQPELAVAEIPEPHVGTGRSGRGTARFDDDRIDIAAEALATRDDRDVHAARLFYQHGLSIREVAHATDAPEGTVKRRLHNARNRIRTMIEKGT